MNNIMNKTGIKRVTFYVANPVECCDRCSTGIKNVFLVEYHDGLVQRYGSECIDKILSNVPDMKKLWSKNVKLLQTLKDSLEILSRKPEDMPRGYEYYDSGLFFVTDSKGKRIIGGGRFGHMYFHPLFDVEKNQSGDKYVVTMSKEQYFAEQLAKIERDKIWFVNEIRRVENFLAKIMQKAHCLETRQAAAPQGED